MRTRRGKLLSTVCALIAAAGAWLIVGSVGTSEAAITSEVIIMRCLPMPAPPFGYQVATFSRTQGIEVDIAASTVDGEGANCAMAISQILGVQGMTTNKMTLHAGENALVVTFIK